MPFWKHERVTPAQVIILAFLLLILAGTGLLLLPAATSGPGGASLLDALFTATSATCVTGLVIHDTALYWSPFGQAVILALIQAGGMGVVTMAVAVNMFAGRKIGLKQRWVMQESIAAPQVGGILRQTKFILKTAFFLEAAGAGALALRFCPQFGLGRGLWYAVFHAVSAFCNAGFDLMGTQAPFSSLTAYADDPLVTLTTASLIILGGLGFLTWHDLWEHRFRLRLCRLQTKLILFTTALLLLGGFAFFWHEFTLPQWGELTAGERGLAAAFQAVTPRTAGFNTVELGKLSGPGRLATILLMLTGGSPGSTAGGFKTTTLAVLLLTVQAVFRRRESPGCFGRRFPDDALRSATAIFLLYILLFLAGGVLICRMDGEVSLPAALFETASAIGTVGLSLGITPGLSAGSRLVLIVLMYFGRVGGLTLLYAVADRAAPGVSQLPRERVAVG